MKINVINRLDIECLERAIVKAKPFDYMVMNSQTRLEISCNSDGKMVTYQIGNHQVYKYGGNNVAINEALQDGEVEFVRKV